MVECGARFFKNLYVQTILDKSTGDCTVVVELTTDEGVTTEIVGYVEWEEGE